MIFSLYDFSLFSRCFLSNFWFCFFLLKMRFNRFSSFFPPYSVGGNCPFESHEFKKDTGSADAALAEREGFALSFASVLVAPSRLGNFLSVASCSLFLPIRSAEIARSNPTSLRKIQALRMQHWRRERDSNPRESVLHPLHDFQSCPFDHSGTSPKKPVLFFSPLSFDFSIF